MQESVVAFSLRIMPQLMIGLGNTMKIYLSAILPALIIGFLCGIGKAKGPKALRYSLNAYTWAWRGTPLLLQVMIMKFGLPAIGIQTDDFIGAIVVFSLNMGAYATEIMRAAIEAVDKGQYEACKALCIPAHVAMMRIIIPQSIRIAIPPACSEVINLIKDTAIVYILGIQDFLRVADQITSREKTVIPFVIVLFVYLIITSVMVKFFYLLEKKVTAYD